MLLTDPYMDLARAYTGKWFTGYGYDARSNVIRVFLSTDRPDAPKQGHHAPKAAVAGQQRHCQHAVPRGSAVQTLSPPPALSTFLMLTLVGLAQH